ncbi:MAG TPA: hypothetical protein VF691_01560, partial [Cytophagaceae bacterium]
DGAQPIAVAATIDPNEPDFLKMEEYEQMMEQGYVLAVKPQSLNLAKDFKAFWKASWAKSLISYHPEYCYYENCVANSTKNPLMGYSSAQFDDRLQIIETWDDATTRHDNPTDGLTDSKFLNALFDPADVKISSDFLLKKDPYFAGSALGSGKYQEFKNKLSNYVGSGTDALSLIQYVAISQRCPGYYHADAATFKSNENRCTAFGENFYQAPANDEEREENKRIKDQEWGMYNSLYQSEKQKYQQNIADINCASLGFETYKGGYNGCIGVSNYQPYQALTKLLKYDFNFKWNDFLGFRNSTTNFRGSYLYTLRQHDPGQPCSWRSYRQYANKIKRFANGSDMNEKLNICEGEDPFVSATKSKNKAELEHFLKSGQDNVTFSLEYFLSGLARSGKLKSGTRTSSKKLRDFSQALYDHLKYGEEKALNLKDTYSEMFLNTSVIGNLNWTGTFTSSPALTKNCGETKLSIPAGAAHLFSAYDEKTSKNVYYTIPLTLNTQPQTVSAYEYVGNTQLSTTRIFSVAIT